MVVSCDKEELVQEQNVKNDSSIAQKQSSMFSYIQSIKINNGVDCENNILIFPSWGKLWETADLLDEKIDYECDMFDATVPNNITDDDYDSLADALGFDEDNVLRSFENDLGFCSLRRKIEGLENDWLELQGDGEWNINEDPDNHFIYDETERTLFSVNTEVIIGETEAEYVYYKLIDDFNWIEVHNWDLEAIRQVSIGIIPINNSNVIVQNIVMDEVPETPLECITHIKTAKYHVNGSNRIKQKSKLINDNPWGPKKISALTVGYKKKNGKWKRRRTTITAGVTGVYGTNNSLLYIDCTVPLEKYKVKERKRRRVKAKIRGHRFTNDAGAHLENFKIGVKPQSAYSYHKQGAINLKLDYYDMQ